MSSSDNTPHPRAQPTSSRPSPLIQMCISVLYLGRGLTLCSVPGIRESGAVYARGRDFLLFPRLRFRYPSRGPFVARCCTHCPVLIAGTSSNSLTGLAGFRDTPAIGSSFRRAGLRFCDTPARYDTVVLRYNAAPRYGRDDAFSIRCAD